METPNTGAEGVRAVFLRNGNAKAVYSANPTIFNAMSLKLNNGSLVDDKDKFEAYCNQTDFNSTIYNFVKVK